MSYLSDRAASYIWKYAREIPPEIYADDRLCAELVEEMEEAIEDRCIEWLEAIKRGKPVGLSFYDWVSSKAGRGLS